MFNTSNGLLPSTPSEVFYSTSLAILSFLTLSIGTIDHFYLSSSRSTRPPPQLSDDDPISPSQHFPASQDEHKPSLPSPSQLTSNQSKRNLFLFKANYLLVFSLVMGADWMQGPYVFSLYSEEYHLSIHTIAILFVLGFLSAGVTAPYVGKFSDSHGRKSFCLLFCILYALSCLCKFSPSLYSLSLGRLLSGVSTSILFSSFESWMISEAGVRCLPCEDLGQLLGRCTLVNGVVASATGIGADWLVGAWGTFKAPFLMSAGLLVVAGVIIATSWNENYGKSGEHEVVEGPGSEIVVDSVEQETGGLWNALKAIAKNPRLIGLGLVMTAFETSMYLFVFLWVPTLQSLSDPSKGALPFGTIFSTFMVSLMLGSILYNGLLSRFNSKSSPLPLHLLVIPTYIISPLPQSPMVPSSPTLTISVPNSPTTSSSGSTLFESPPSTPLRRCSSSLSSEYEAENPNELTPLLLNLNLEKEQEQEQERCPSVSFHGKLCCALLVVASISLGVAAKTENEKVRWAAYVAFEFCVGGYYPVVATLRSSLIPENYRATITALFRVPLNLFITLALVSGMESRPGWVAVGSCVGMLGAAGWSWRSIARS